MEGREQTIFECEAGFWLRGWDSHSFRTILAICLAFAVVLYTVWIRRLRELVSVSCRDVIFITGCDSGIGLTLAHHCANLGYTVVASVLHNDSNGATLLRQAARVHVVHLDVTDVRSVQKAVDVVGDVVNAKVGYRLAALVNNAGVLVFGEFSWQTDRQVHHQLAVNVEGTMRVTRALLPMLRRDAGRVVIVSSHCAEAALPALSVYSATKAALQGWADGLRIEEAQYGVDVVQFVPGSFVMQTSLLMHHEANAAEQRTSLSAEDRLKFGTYFETFHAYMSMIASRAAASAPPGWDGLIRDRKLLRAFTLALLRRRPSRQYVNAPLRYSVYHTLFKMCPLHLRDQLVVRFAALPRYSRVKSTKN